jgi:signal transduction histidine kinase
VTRHPLLRAWVPAVGLAAYGAFEALSGIAPGVGQVPGDERVSALAAVVAGLAVAARAHRPLQGLAAVVLAVTAEAALTDPAEGLAPLLSQLVLLYAVASRTSLRAALAALALVVGLVGSASGDVVFVAVLSAVPWLAGRVLGERQRQLADLQVTSAEQATAAVAEERQRIARDLHDVVSHALSLVVVQAQLAQATVRTDPDAAEQALGAVKGAAQQALSDMRRMLGVLSPDGEVVGPQPGLADVPLLLERVRAAGLDVRWREDGEPRELAPGASMTAYRVLQEGLTNALRHAGSRRADVRVAWTPAALSLLVRDEGGGGGEAGAGRGLLGLRERVAVYGGTLRAEPVPGGFELEAVLPS